MEDHLLPELPDLLAAEASLDGAADEVLASGCQTALSGPLGTASSQVQLLGGVTGSCGFPATGVAVPAWEAPWGAEAPASSSGVMRGPGTGAQLPKPSSSASGFTAEVGGAVCSPHSGEGGADGPAPQPPPPPQRPDMTGPGGPRAQGAGAGSSEGTAAAAAGGSLEAQAAAELRRFEENPSAWLGAVAPGIKAKAPHDRPYKMRAGLLLLGLQLRGASSSSTAAAAAEAEGMLRAKWRLPVGWEPGHVGADDLQVLTEGPPRLAIETNGPLAIKLGADSRGRVWYLVSEYFKLCQGTPGNPCSRTYNHKPSVPHSCANMLHNYLEGRRCMLALEKPDDGGEFETVVKTLGKMRGAPKVFRLPGRQEVGLYPLKSPAACAWLSTAYVDGSAAAARKAGARAEASSEAAPADGDSRGGAGSRAGGAAGAAAEAAAGSGISEASTGPPAGLAPVSAPEGRAVEAGGGWQTAAANAAIGGGSLRAGAMPLLPPPPPHGAATQAQAQHHQLSAAPEQSDRACASTVGPSAAVAGAGGDGSGGAGGSLGEAGGAPMALLESVMGG